MKTFDEFIADLKKIKQSGYIRTNRSGNTGVGKTLEDLLGIKENNIPTPNCIKAELKAARKNASSMLTLFTKSPLPPKANSALLKNFGYHSARGNNRLELHTTVNAVEFNQIKGEQGFKIDIQQDKVNLVSSKNEILGYWDKETLKKSFERKLPKLLYIKADCKSAGRSEEFWYNEGWLLEGFDFGNFVKLLKETTIKVDIRIGQYQNGETHDHGTAFRILPSKLDLCFSKREKVL